MYILELSLHHNTIEPKINKNMSEEHRQIYYFAKLRENYFKYLKRVVSENCRRCWQMPFTDNTIDELSLNIEQHALLASLQIEIYQKSMNKIICDIKKVTSENLIYHKIEPLLSNRMKDVSRTSSSLKSLNFSCANFKNANKSRSESVPGLDVRGSMENFFPSESTYSELSSATACRSNLELNGDRFSRNQHCPLTGAQDFSNESFQMALNSRSNANPDFLSPPNSAHTTKLTELKSTGNTDEYKNNECEVKKPISLVFPQVVQVERAFSNRTISFNHRELDNEVDYSDIDNDFVNADDYDVKADILQILEGQCKSDSNHSGDFRNSPDSRNEITAAAVSFVKDRKRKPLGLNRETLFPGDRNKESRKEKSAKFKTDTFAKNKIKSVDWRLEKNIQMYNFYLRYSQLPEEDRIKNEIIFVDLFGEGSGDEEESDYSSYSLYYTSCVERISPWVVKYLMPYYRQHRIIGRDVFKKLGLHVSKLIIDKVQYPDEGLVQSLVSKFFSNSIIYTCESDIVEVTVCL